MIPSGAFNTAKQLQSGDEQRKLDRTRCGLAYGEDQFGSRGIIVVIFEHDWSHIGMVFVTGLAREKKILIGQFKYQIKAGIFYVGLIFLHFICN